MFYEELVERECAVMEKIGKMGRKWGVGSLLVNKPVELLFLSG
jgi:hypothetical protein